MRVIARSDSEWPVLLDEVASPPDVLYAAGLPLDLDRPMIAIVGTRKPTIAGIEIAERLARGLTEGGFTVVSGLAVGIDAVAHRAALQAGGTTVAVLGCGLDVRYPRPNLALRADIEQAGTVVTEYPQGTAPTAFTFPQRNRIIAGLAIGTVVVEGGLRSGALVTARHALDANRSCYAVPGSLRNPMAAGPNHLIKMSRAALITTFKDICDDLAPSLVWSAKRGSDKVMLSEHEIALLHALDDTPAAPDRLIKGLSLPPGKVAMTLSRLEVRGWALRSPRGYALTSTGARVRACVEAGPRSLVDK